MKTTLFGAAILAAAAVGCTEPEKPKEGTTGAASTTSANKPAPDKSAAPEAPKVIEPKWMAKLDADMKEVIVELGTLGGKPVSQLQPAEARKQPTPADAVKSLLTKKNKDQKPEEVAKVEDKKIPVKGGEVPIRIYTPKDGKAPLPTVVYFHGGGFVIADNDTYDATPRAIANAAKAVVISVDYRKGPEHRFPTAQDDAYAAYQWALKNGPSYGGDGKKFAVLGESAGGNLAANVAIMARDKKEKAPLAMVLVYPLASTDMTGESYGTYADAKPLNKAMMGWFMEKYAGKPEDGADPRLNLVGAKLDKLPPTTIINAEVDPLTSSGLELAKKLKDAGTKVDQKTYEGVTHEFFGMGAYVSDAKDAVKYAASQLDDAFD